MSEKYWNDSARQEWNAAYFLGLREVVTRGFVGTFDAQVALGAGLLAENGYVVGTPCSGDGVESPLVAEHRGAARELSDGTFDAIGRARKTVQWLSQNVPRLNTDWLRRLVSLYDNTHPTDAATFSEIPRAVSGEETTFQGGGAL